MFFFHKNNGLLVHLTQQYDSTAHKTSKLTLQRQSDPVPDLLALIQQRQHELWWNVGVVDGGWDGVELVAAGAAPAGEAEALAVIAEGAPAPAHVL